MLAAGLDPLVAFWKEWGIQMLVLLSLALQVILLVTAEIRRRKDSGVLRVVVWSAYLLADTTAIYTLGHMSVTSRSPEHELVAFWAPFLLLHLGGQDNITAYSIDDNRLWLRHLQSFVVQVLAAAYVLYESSIFVGGRQTMLGQATLLMFVVGVVKYGERVWALMSASSSSLSGKNYNSFGRLHFERPNTTITSLPAPFLAHDLLNVPKHLLKGPLPLLAFDSKLGYFSWEDMYHVAEIQLSLMHDVFYSKAELIHTWYGYCIRVAFLPATVTALLLFRRVGDKDDFSKVDLVATYVLLSGAVVLEITSVLRAMSSTWICPFCERILNQSSMLSIPLLWLLLLVFAFGELVGRAIQKVGILKRYWSGSMGQHNFIYMCSHCKDSRSSKTARWMGREDWWNTLVYTSSSVPVSEDFSMMLKEQLRGSVGVTKENRDHIQNSRGLAALKKRGLHEELAWSVDSELDESILVWHIATDVYLSWYEAEHKRLPPPAKVTQELSNYMMFLLAARPYMLPDNATRQRYIELCNKVIYHLKLQYSSAEDLIKLMQGHGDALNAEQTQPAVVDMPAATTKESSVTFDRACQLGSKLISKGLETPDAMLDLISQVWVEMLCYTGYRCRPDSHARQLSSGGEITTVVAILMELLKTDFLNFNSGLRTVVTRS
ncbi:unnamed protein product [Triticum aestivum]|uniref:DUF4220 domain-containing protein n=2 Tax=Triticum aestivum TaxID=4565 RepID=A0A9R1JDN5_WHEAT|nr:uncharacterized protein LOC123051335 [Triticum aestivum]KAF7013675.1 hypothetical protein CFC21_027742 [Triticum aestivum]SPT16042.1 unnamed protein product [Triticum aestivum]